MSYADRIKPTDDSIMTYLESLKKKQYQIPTFQREVVWEKDSVKKLWDSIYKFYPIGSILVWKTDIELQNHREIGGHLIADDLSQNEFRYILDGQQRTVSLLTSLYSGRIKGKDNFDPALYIDISLNEDEADEEEQKFKERFLFWDDIDDRNGQVKRNIPRKKKYEEGLIIRLKDIKENYDTVEKSLYDKGYIEFDHPHRNNLRKIRNVLDNYRISFIELRGIEVSEVCEIFERINQEGKPLDIFDIVVAKTYRPPQNGQNGFYLRELIESFRSKADSNFGKELEDFTYLQMLAVMVMQNFENTGLYNITDTYLNRIKAEQIDYIWEEASKAFLKTFDFFDNHLHIRGPRLIPFRYLFMTIAEYFFNHKQPNYDLLKQYYWYYSFHSDELLRNTTHLKSHLNKFKNAKENGVYEFDRFLLDKNDLRNASYSSKGRFSRAILSLFSNHKPRDWKHIDRTVISETYYLLSDKPNLHHIFPTSYISENPGNNQVDVNSLMNIAFLPQITNLEISNKNPLKYFKEYDNGAFESVLDTHLIPQEILEWSRKGYMPDDALDILIEKRIGLIVDELKNKLEGIRFQTMDTKDNS